MEDCSATEPEPPLEVRNWRTAALNYNSMLRQNKSQLAILEVANNHHIMVDDNRNLNYVKTNRE